MAYRRTYRRRKMSRGKRRARRTGAQAGALAYNAYSLAKKVARMVNSEIKFHDVQATNTAYDSTGTIVNLSTIAQGDGDNARDGSSIKLAHLTMRMSWSSNTTDTTPQRVRMILFRGKNEKSTPPTISTLLEDTTQYDNIVSPKNWDHKFNTRVLYDRVIVLTPNASASNQSKELVISKKLYGHVKFATNDTAGTDIENGGLYMLIVSDETTNAPTCTFYSRLTFYDN